MFRILFSIISLCFLIPSLFAQQISWYKTFDISQVNYQYGNCAIQTLDGGYAVIARDKAGDDIYLLKINRYGEQEWLKTIDSSRIGYYILQNSDSSFIIAGNDLKYAKLIKTDKNGNRIWRKLYSINNEACSFYKVKLLDNGDLIACGDIGPFPSDIFVVKTNSSGDTIWQRTVSDSGTQEARDIAVMDNHVYVTGLSLHQGKGKTILTKFSENGNLVWYKKTGSNGKGDGEYGLSISSGVGNKVIVAGTIYDNTMPDGYLAWYDTSGNSIEKKIYSSIYRLTSMTMNASGYAFIGENTFGNNIRFIKTNLSGVEIYNKVLGNFDEVSISGISINTVNDNGFVISGSTTSGNEDSSEVLVIKTDSTGYAQTVAINLTGTEIPEKFQLFQNYPNPFNPVTNLGFGISDLGFVSLKIYDLNGKEVAVLVNEMKAPGNYNYQFSTIDYLPREAGQLASGIYFYSLSVDGKVVDTKRMILLK